jgi:hypothetical protein
MMRTAAELETLRIHAHLLTAEQFARSVKPKRMPWLKALTRQLLLEELARYRRRLRYPKNYDFPGKRVPHFVDDHGTRCAVAHLLEVGGQAQLVEKSRVSVTTRASESYWTSRLSLSGWLTQA